MSELLADARHRRHAPRQHDRHRRRHRHAVRLRLARTSRTAERALHHRRRRRDPVEGAVRFVGLHIRTPMAGVAVHINAFNFPCWGLLEKFAPAFLAGMPVITKPATATAYVAEALMPPHDRIGNPAERAPCNSSPARPAICSTI